MFGFGIKVPEISVDEIKEMIDKGENPTIIDVRTPQEFQKGKIYGSINIPLDEIELAYQRFKDKSQNIYVYCLSGSRSVIATNQLIEMGYVNAFNVKSGLLAWRARQFPLDQ